MSEGRGSYDRYRRREARGMLPLNNRVLNAIGVVLGIAAAWGAGEVRQRSGEADLLESMRLVGGHVGGAITRLVDPADPYLPTVLKEGGDYLPMLTVPPGGAEGQTGKGDGMAAGEPISDTGGREAATGLDGGDAGSEKEKKGSVGEFIGRMGGALVLDARGNLLAYKLDSGETVEFDPDNQAELRRRAKETRQVQLVASIPVKETDSSVAVDQDVGADSEAHPVYSELPADDFLSSEELEKRGVKVIQTDKVELYIRESAFTGDGPLADIYQASGEVTIVLVDGPCVSGVYLGDARYDQVRSLVWQVDDDVERLREGKLATIRETIGSVRQKIADTVKNGDGLSEQEVDEKVAAENGYLLALLLDEMQYAEMPVEQLLEEAGQTRAAGLHVYQGPNRSTIFIAVGERPDRTNNAVIYIDQNGEYQAVQSSRLRGNPGIGVYAEQSQPEVSSWPRNPRASAENPGVYPYAGVTPGFGLSHELAHGVFVSKAMKPIYNEVGEVVGVEPNVVDGIRQANPSEYDADMYAYTYLLRAYRRWRKTGDISGYHFAFSLPDGSGYILTDNKPVPGDDTHRVARIGPRGDKGRRYREHERRWQTQTRASMLARQRRS